MGCSRTHTNARTAVYGDDPHCGRARVAKGEVDAGLVLRRGRAAVGNVTVPALRIARAAVVI
jgi:hypothetical protein